MTVYIDVILLENLCMNYIILFGTGYILKTKIKHYRLLLSSLLGAIYAILVYMNILEFYSSFIVKVILSICMVYIAYNPKRIKAMLKELIVFYLVSFALGGCAFALLYIVKPQNILIKNGAYIGTYPIKIVLLGGIVGFTVTYIAFKVVKNKMSNKELIYEINIKMNDKELETKVLLDTGNMLKDPISNIPVILLEKNKLYGILPSNLLDNINDILGGDVYKNDLDEKLKFRLRIIPFTSIGKQNGMIIGIKVDEVIIFNDLEEVKINNVIIGIYDKTFSRNGKYFGLIGLDILNGNNVSGNKLTKDNFIKGEDKIKK